MKGKKFLPVLVLVCLVALGAMGVAYAAWTDTITINGAVNTGDLNIAWDVTGVSEVDPLATPGDAAGTCTALPDDATNTLAITLNGAYPTYKCVVAGHIVNTGTVPARLIDEDLNVAGMPSGAVSLTLNDTIGVGVDGSIVPVGKFLTSEVTIEVLSGAAESTSYSATYTLIGGVQ